MSAYAMPGLLFPPVASARKEEMEETATVEDVIPKQSLESVYSADSASEVGIAVKAARIDPMRLIHSRSRSKTSSKGMTKITEAAAHARGYWGEFSSDSDNESSDEEDEYYEEWSEEVAPMSQFDGPSSLDDTSSSTPNGEAIQFELNISYNGREYTATRTLPRIMKLRDELKWELESRRDRQCGSKPSLSQEFARLQVKEESEVTIPELPIGSQDEQSAVVAGGIGSGFTMLHSMLQTYCPAIERWLLNVANIVPPSSSQSLTNFLWEPLARNNSDCTRIFKASQRYGSLGVVYEELEETEGDSEEEVDIF